MATLCYFCNKQLTENFQQLVNLKSKHSGRPITDYIKKFLGPDFVSHRMIHDESNCICFECLSRIYSYDWMSTKIKDLERELRSLILFTESQFDQIKTETIVLNGNDVLMEDADSKNDVKPSIPMPRSIVVQPSLSVSNNDKSAEPAQSSDAVKKSKPIIVRVVKRVPFLKKPVTAVQPNKAVSKVVPQFESSLHAQIMESSKKFQKIQARKRAKASRKKKIQPKTDEVVIDVIPIKCEFCETVFEHITLLQVIVHFKFNLLNIFGWRKLLGPNSLGQSLNMNKIDIQIAHQYQLYLIIFFSKICFFSFQFPGSFETIPS